MEKILPVFVADGGEEWFDIAQKGAKMPVARTGRFGRRIRNSKAAKYASTKEIFESYRPKGRFFVSNDDAATYCIAARRSKLALIVFDAHMDIYGFGGKLEKAGWLRALDEGGVPEKIVFVGTRASEELIYHEHKRKVRAFNRKFAAGWRANGTFLGIKAKIEIIPADEIGSFEEGLRKAVEATGKGRSGPVGINVDVDVFEGIGGCQYNEKFPGKIRKFVNEREGFARENGMRIDGELKKEILDYAEFVENELEERGLPPEINEKAVGKILGALGGRLAFFHVTEYDDAIDGNGEAEEICNRLLAAAGPKKR
jgi:hypothetical protein